MVYRIYVEKKPGFDVEANGLKNELTSLLGIKDLTGLRLLNRYDVEGIDEALFNQCVSTVFRGRKPNSASSAKGRFFTQQKRFVRLLLKSL